MRHARMLVAGSLSLVFALSTVARADQAAQTQPSGKGARAAAAGDATKDSNKTGAHAAAKGTMPVKPAKPPQHIQVQHILIGFKGSVPGKPITRSMAEARKLAHEILQKARGGANFDSLVQKYTDDQAPGIYGMANTGVAKGDGEFERQGMVPAFGNVGFNLSVGNIGIAEYDKTKSPFGFHIIKRVK